MADVGGRMLESEDSVRVRHGEPWWPLALILLAIISVCVCYAALVVGYIPDGESPERARAFRGQFGDMFGGLNALFSGTAFAVLIYSLFLQRTELRLQREELEYTRHELARSASAQEKAEQALKEQAEAMRQFAKAAGEQVRAMQSLADATRQQERHDRDVADATRRQVEATRDLTTAIRNKSR